MGALQNVFGSESSPVFDGNILANATAAARKVKALGVLNYGPQYGMRGTGKNRKKVNLREERKNNYNASIGVFRNLFDCLR